MTNLIDNYLLQSGMPSEELKQIDRTKRSFYYYGMAFLGGIAIVLISSGLFNILT